MLAAIIAAVTSGLMSGTYYRVVAQASWQDAESFGEVTEFGSRA